MWHLGQEDQDRELVDEPQHHGPRHEAHQFADAEVAEADLEDARQDRRGEQVLDAVFDVITPPSQKSAT